MAEKSAAERLAEEQRATPIAGRALLVLLTAVMYGWLAPLFLRTRPYVWTPLLTVHALTFIGALAIAIGRTPKRPNRILGWVTAAIWLYLFGFVVLNSWGS